MRTRLIVVSAPSGAGKTSLCERALKDYALLEDVITYTTREMRPGEKEGEPYHFVTQSDFENLKNTGFFIEWAIVHNNQYGTPKHVFSDAWDRGKHLIMDVDVQGAATLRKVFPDATFVFILPPNLDELRNRLTKRDGSKAKDLEVRLKNAEMELEHASEFEYKIVNDNFDSAYEQFKKIIEDSLIYK